jgi:ABC-type dipeptide/oligopeptide/nickel transport system ATPase component
MLEVKDLTIKFRSELAETMAVKSLSFRLEKGETLAIVGESGSGKSVTALALTRLLPEPPTIYEGGDILLDGRSILGMKQRELRSIRGKQIAYIFQEPATSLNPVYSIYEQIAETIRLHRPDVPDIRREVIYWLDQVGIKGPEKRMRVADEPTTALDVTIQKQILDLFRTLKQKSNMSIILITHNFGIIGGLADKVAVMFRGELVEFGLTASVLSKPQHHYTRALIECVPKLGVHLRRLKTIAVDA